MSTVKNSSQSSSQNEIKAAVRRLIIFLEKHQKFGFWYSDLQSEAEANFRKLQNQFKATNKDIKQTKDKKRLKEFSDHYDTLMDEFFNSLTSQKELKLENTSDFGQDIRDTSVIKAKSLFTDLIYFLDFGDLEPVSDLAQDSSQVRINIDTFDAASISYLLEYLSALEIDDYEDVFVLGTFEKKKTFETQQIRAAILALASYLKDPTPKKHVAVIGGGLAGMTYAAVATKLGIETTIFELGDDLAPLQRDCFDRYVNPNLYDWPKLSTHEDCFTIGGLSWKHDFAGNIVRSVAEQLITIAVTANSSLLLNPKLGTEIKGLKRGIEIGKDGKYYLHKDGGKLLFGAFDSVIFAVGYGIEDETVYDVRQVPYWHKFPLYKAAPAVRQGKKRILVSGSGDGGLIDLILATLENFDHSKIFTILPELHESRNIEIILKAEEEIESISKIPNAKPDIISIYNEHFSNWGWIEKLKEYKHKHRDVHFSSRELGSLFSPNSAIINRLIAYFLVNLEMVEVRTGSLSTDTIKRSTKNGSIEYTINWNDGKKDTYDNIIMRHGVSVNRYFAENFPHLKNDITNLPQKLLDLDRTKSCPSEIIEFLQNI